MKRIGITLGDPAGIGPEIVAKSLLDERMPHEGVVLIGNSDNFFNTVRKLHIEEDKLLDLKFIDIPGEKVVSGKISGESGRIARESIEKAVSMAMNGDITGFTTAPINKEAFLLGGAKYKDHTDMLGALTKCPEVVTLFEVQSLRIIFLTKHVSLREACDLVKKDAVYRHIVLADRSLQSLGIKGGRIAVAALNPHAGENGMFGKEEIDEITPAIGKASEKFDVSGPIPADSVFHKASLGEYDIVLSMYHDQGHIAAKSMNFEKTVSMNLGLPFLRTSVDHGTAFDIAGKGIADHTSMIEAELACIKYSPVYSRNRDVFTQS